MQTNNATYYGTAQPEQQWGIEQVHAVETGRDVVVASVNGISGFLPRRTYELGQIARGFPDRQSVALLRAAGIRFVVLHPALATNTAWATAASRPVARLGIERRAEGGVVLFDLTPRSPARR